MTSGNDYYYGAGQSTDYMSPYYGQPSYSASSYDNSYGPRSPAQAQPYLSSYEPAAPVQSLDKREAKPEQTSQNQQEQDARVAPLQTIKDQQNQPSKKSAPTPKKQVNTVQSPLEKQLSKFEDSIALLKEGIEQSHTLKTLKDHITSNEEPDFVLITEGMKDIISALKNAKKNLVSLIQEAKKISLDEKLTLQKKLSGIMKDARETITPLMGALQVIEEKQNQLTIPPVKRFFYLADASQKDAVIANTPKEFHPFVEQQAIAIATNTAQTLFSIAKEWNDLNDTVETDFNELLPKKRRKK